MDQQLRDKISKIYELVNRGATEGERAAAKNLLDKILAKHNLKDINLDQLDKSSRRFKYSNRMELVLITQLYQYFIGEIATANAKRYVGAGVREVSLNLNDQDYITIECAYEYFRRHMKLQWKKLCLEELKKCRKARTFVKRRKELQNLFIDQYIIASKLVEEQKLIAINIEELSRTELKDRQKLSGIQGGKYNQQLSNGLYLNQ